MCWGRGADGKDARQPAVTAGPIRCLIEHLAIIHYIPIEPEHLRLATPCFTYHYVPGFC